MSQIKNDGSSYDGVRASQERRAWQRFMLEDPAYLALEIEGSGQNEEAELVDLSLGGLRLRFGRELPPGTMLSIRHPTAGNLLGRLAWQSDGDIGVSVISDEKRRTYLLRLISMILHSELQVAAA